MTITHNRHPFLKIRQLLRRNSTPAEILLWNRLRDRRMCGHKFRRQHSIGRYVLDFYSPKLRLGIELDGSQHLKDDQVDYDQARTDWLAAQNIKIIRYWNNEILNQMESVLEDIYRTIKELPNQ